MLLHYPSPHSEKHGGYVTEDGHATDDTTRMTNEATANVQMVKEVMRANQGGLAQELPQTRGQGG